MIILDTNILLYAYVPSFPQHKKASVWLERTLSRGEDSIGIIWQVATGFIRISTSSRAFQTPFSIALAKSCLDEMFAHPLVVSVVPTARHWETYSAMLLDQNLSGDIVMDAHIAAVASEHKAAVASADNDFRRFSDYVKIINPLKDR